jgi:erythritol kinase (D-erythritol 1-phosphate-forming)
VFGAGAWEGHPDAPGAGGSCPILPPPARGRRSWIPWRGDVLEGLTLVIRDSPHRLRRLPQELRVCGGGAASALWLQLIADVTGIPVLRSTDTDVGAKGAFLIGLAATGGAPGSRSR